jgi:hypothetical protein
MTRSKSPRLSRELFIRRHGWHLAPATGSFWQTIDEYDRIAMLNDYLAGVVYERTGRYEPPTLEDYDRATELYEIAQREFDLTTMYDTEPDPTTPAPPFAPGTGPVNETTRKDQAPLTTNTKQAGGSR